MSDKPSAFVRGQGGAIFEMDIPAGGHALERWEADLASGALVIVPEAHWVDGVEGARVLVAGPAPKAAPKSDVADKADKPARG